MNKIIDKENWNNAGIAVFSYDTLQQFKTLSGKLAENNEFQMHYWALIVRGITSTDNFIDICIPTIVFNYPQKVSGASIDFEMKDVIKVSEEIEPIHNVQVNQLIKSGLIEEIKQWIRQNINDIKEIKLLSSNYNSNHFHP